MEFLQWKYIGGVGIRRSWDIMRDKDQILDIRGSEHHGTSRRSENQDKSEREVEMRKGDTQRMKVRPQDLKGKGR